MHSACLHWLRGLRLVAGRLELLTVCAGAVLAAHAGLLAGRRATTHHQHLDELAAIEPRCDVVANRVFVSDGALYSSAGVATGMDLTLYRIAETCGPAIAAHVAQTLVLAQRRGPEDPQFSPFLDHRNHLHAALHRVQDAVAQAPQQEWIVAAMAAVACTSPRHLTRLFVEHAGIAPGLAAPHPARNGRGGLARGPPSHAGGSAGGRQLGHATAPGLAPVRSQRNTVPVRPPSALKTCATMRRSV
jgi:transcriptional regulator GlxA family with amidase domain